MALAAGGPVATDIPPISFFKLTNQLQVVAPVAGAPTSPAGPKESWTTS